MTAAQLQQAIAYLFPSAILGVTYTASVDSSGNATVALWSNAVGPEPDAAALTTALAASQLATAKGTQIGVLNRAYSAVRFSAPVTVTVGSASLTFPTDTATQMNVMGYLTAYSTATAPATMPLQDADGTAQNVTYAELQSLAAAIANQSVAAWTKLQGLLAAVQAAATVAAVEGVAW